MAQAQTKLTTWQAACIITGYGVGSGIMTLPYLVNRAGIISCIVILLVAFFFSYCMHMMLAEMIIGSGRDAQIVTMFKKFLFKGKFARVLTAVFFALTVVVLIANLAAYIAGGAEILQAAGLSPMAAKLVFYAIAASVVLFGLKVLGMSESISIAIIIAIIAVLAGASLFHLMAMFSFVAFFSVPQAVQGLNGNPAKVRHAILLGLGLNLAFIVVIVGCSLAASASVTELAIIGWSQGIGTWAQVLGSVFTILAMLTTYWSISLALSDIVREQTNWNKNLCWLIATLPSLLLVLANAGSFLDIMRIVGGLISVMIAILVVPAYRACRKENGQTLLPTSLSSLPMQILVAGAFIIAAVGSAVSI